MNRLSDFIGNTPLIRVPGLNSIYAKAEFMNPSGSIKDRMAKYIIDDAEERGLIKHGDTLCEATSGNTGIALSMIAAERGYNMEIIMPANMSDERKQMFAFYGANLREVADGDFDHAILVRNTMSVHNGWFNCNQFHNPLNELAHYETTGPEIFRQFTDNDITQPSALILGTGTGGTLMGTGRYLKEQWPDMKIIAVEPKESPVMSGGTPGLHGIQGIGDGSKFLVDMEFVDDVITVKTQTAKNEARQLASNGLFVGISSGANIVASKIWQNGHGKDTNILTILSDRGERYLSCM